MAGFSGSTYGASKKLTNKQIAMYLTSGATPKGSWNASTNTPHLANGTGSLGWYYDVVVAGTSLGQTFLVGDRIMYNSSDKWERVPTGVESETPMVIEYVSENTDHLPSIRKSGNPLKIGDYVQVLSTATLPFVIDGITFDSYGDIAEWNGTTWQEKSYVAGQTNEVGVKNATEESLSGTATYQNDINKENKEAINNKVEKSNINNKRLAYTRIAGVEGTLEIATTETTNTLAQRGTGGRLKVGDAVEDNEAINKGQVDDKTIQFNTNNKLEIKENTFEFNTPNSEWDIIHNLGRYPKVITINSSGLEIFGGIIYSNGNQVKISFAEPETGIAYIY